MSSLNKKGRKCERVGVEIIIWSSEYRFMADAWEL